MNPSPVLATAPPEIIVYPAPAPAPMAPRARGEHRAGWVVLAALVLVVRKPDALINPQFWAEDFRPFFVEAHTVGPQVLAMPYNGYLHLLPRLIAWLAAPLRASIQPAAYVAAALGITLVVVAQALSPRVALPGRPWLALAIVAVPHTGEVFLNLTNLQWITALGLVLTLLKRDPADATEWGVDVAVLVVAGLTGPFSVLVLPLFLVRAWLRGTGASWTAAGIVALPAVVQAWYLCHAPALPHPGAWHAVDLLGVLAVRLPMTLVMGETWPVKIAYAGTTALGVAIAMALVFLSVRRGPCRAARWWLLAALAVLLLAGIKRGRPDTWAFYDTFNGDRYFYAPKVMVLWLVVVVIAELRARWQRAVGAGLLALAFVANLPAFRIKPLPDLHWASHSDRIQAGERVEVPINPGWKVVYPGRPAK
ncbi:MAG: hypothetical protein H7343_18045 [Undibacterium sp.]|nr:hypothetical protein [Opitutaceae bacterium]